MKKSTFVYCLAFALLGSYRMVAAGPAVSIVNPVNNASFGAPAYVTISATASTTQGTVTNIEFYAGSTLLGGVSASPYQFTWTNAQAGSYLLKAVAVDNGGIRTTSSPVNINVIRVISSQWASFNDQSQVGNPNDTAYTISSLGTSSGALKNIDSGASVAAYLTITNTSGPSGANDMSAPASGTPAYNIFNGYIDWTGGGNPGIRINSGNVIGYTFSRLDPEKRYRFVATSVRGSTTAASGNEYSNRWTQAEIVGAVSYTPAHSSNVVTSQEYPANLKGSQAAWNAGQNHTAETGDVIEWDNIAPSSGGAFTVLCTKYSGPFPGGSAANGQYSYAFSAIKLEEFATGGLLVSVSNPLSDAIVVVPDSVVINAIASDAGGTITNMAYYAGTNKLGDVASAPYIFTWTNATPGTYMLKAVASDNTGLSATSPPVKITVQNNVPPTIAINSPADSSVFNTPTDLLINVAAGDSDDGITNVAFYANGVKIGENNISPFSFNWLNVPEGAYNLTAVATDAHGAATTSSVVRAFVIVSTVPTVESFVPAAGVVSQLTQLTVTFTEPVDGVKASDLLINSLPATSLTGANDVYTFFFPTPMEGIVTMTWKPNHAIVDLENPPKAFDGGRTNEIAHYTLRDTIPPTVLMINPPLNSTVSSLKTIEISFSEPVGGVWAGALLVNGIPAAKVSGSMAGPYTFEFVLPSFNGQAQMTWAANHGIHDFAATPNALVTNTGFYILDHSGAETNVIISEIMYHTSSERPSEQFIELRNKGATPVNLSGWQFSKGIHFSFPDVSLSAGNYLVVAADVAAFNGKYPGVTNVVGGWSGWMTSHLELSDALGQVVNSVQFGSSGDWGVRLRGAGQQQVLGITRSGSTATVTMPGNYQNGDTFIISGADQPEYNGTFTMTGVQNNAPSPCVSFNYTISGSPASPATGTILCRQITDCGHTGLAWASPADGMGGSLELLNENLPNQFGQNWKASLAVNGTPARANSVGTTNMAPMILDARHFPLVPTSTNPVTITAHLMDEHGTGITATLHWRVDSSSAGAFTVVPLYDDGQHNDGASGDGVYGAILAALPNNTVVEFYLEASDAEGNSRTWPAPVLDVNGARIQTANALFQIDNNVYTDSQPMFKLILREVDRDELATFPGSSPWSNCRFNLTMIYQDGTGSDARHLCGIRDRGAGTRQKSPCNHELSFTDDRSWHGVNSINFNTQYTESQIMGYVLGMLSGLDTEAARIVQVRVNNVNRANAGSPQFGSYITLERTDNNYVKNHWPGEDGNIYRGQSWTHSCNLTYHGTNFLDYVNDGYSKQNHTVDNDWSDLMNLCRVLNTNTPDDTVYAAAVREVVDVEQWMRYFAVFNMSASLETAFATGIGDDYSLYRRSRDNRWILMAHDWDTILGQGDTTGNPNLPLFVMCPSVPFGSSSRDTFVLDRFMKHPDFAPIYYQELKRLCDTVFSPAQMNATLDQWVGSLVPTSALNNMKTFNGNRVAYVRSQIPLNLTVSTGLAQSNGCYYTTSPNVTLNGQGNAIDTRSIQVDGQSAAWTAWQATWTKVITLNPGINRIVVQALNASGTEFQRQIVDVWYNPGTETIVAGGSLSIGAVWSPALSPYHVTGNLTIPVGSTLTIQPGATLYFDTGATLTVNGQLMAAGTPGQRIRFTRAPGASGYWGGFAFNNARESNVLAYADVEWTGSISPAVSIKNSQVLIDRCTFLNNNPSSKWFDIWQPQVILRHSVIDDLGSQYICTAENMLADGWFIIDGNLFGKNTDDNDIFHLNRVSVKGGAAAMVINNVFTGAGDDIVDDNETDTHIEGNLLMHANEINTGNHGVSAAVTTGPGGSLGANNLLSQHLTVVRNVFYKNDSAIISKTGAYSQIYNNVFVENNAAILFDETDRSDAGPGRQSYIESCIFWNNKPDNGTNNGALVDVVDPRAFDSGRLSIGQPQVTVNNSILPSRFHNLGTNNLDVNPLFVFPTNFAELSPTNNLFRAGFDGFDSSPYLLANGYIPDFHLRPNSPARGAGFNGMDMGAFVSPDASIAGEPVSQASQTNVVLTVGGTDIYGYKYRVLGPGFPATWSDEQAPMKQVTQITLSGTTARATVTSHGYANGDVIQILGADALTPYFNGLFTITNVTASTFDYSVTPGTNSIIQQTSPRDLWCRRSDPIRLVGLANGTYQVEVIRKNSHGLWQSTAAPSVSKSWTVNVSWPGFRINEILARNETAVPVNGNYPDLVELYNSGPVTLDLAGMSLTDNPSDPRQFVFPSGTKLEAGQYLVVYADNNTTPPGYHLGFALNQDGEALYLFKASGQLLDSVSFGLQTPDLSIGRLSNGEWGLTQPTFGAANVPARLGDPYLLRINEWLASGLYPVPFIELFNPDPQPISLGGLFLTDNLIGAPIQHEIAPLSFVRGGGYAVFLADGNANDGPTHLNFSLSADRGLIALSDGSLALIDSVLYGPQSTGVSRGRSPNGSSNLVYFAAPTAGAPNRAPLPPNGLQLVINELLARNTTGLSNVDGSTPSWIELHNPTASAVDLADLSLSDDARTPRKYVFPAGITIPSGGYLVVLCDPLQPASSTTVAMPNTGFGIGGSGGEVHLFDKLANAGSELDGVAFGLQANDMSIGRVPSGSTIWTLSLPTPGDANIAAQLGDPMELRFNEWMANPSKGAKWFEIYNPNAQPVAMSGLFLTDTLTTPASRQMFKIAPLSFIGTGLYGYVQFWADKTNMSFGPDHVNFGLKTAGESLGLYAPGDQRIDSLIYGPQAQDVSEGRLPDGSTHIVNFLSTSTPGEANYLPLTDLVINEVLSAPTDAPPTEQAIELFNAGSTPLDIGGWYLSNTKRDLMKYQIPTGSVIPAGAYKVFYGVQFYTDSIGRPLVRLDAVKGDQVYLTVTDTNGNLTGYRAVADFGAAMTGVSYGRYTNSVGQVDFTAMSQRTFGRDNPVSLPDFRMGAGALNAYPLVGSIVITEIMYHPIDLSGADNVLDEYLVVKNISGTTTSLFDPVNRQNTWRLTNAISFAFPTGVTLGSNESVLVVSFDPVRDTNSLAAFKAAYPQLPTSMALHGPYSGKLSNKGDNVEIVKPGPPVPVGQPDVGYIPYVVVDHVKYDQKAPWDTTADGTGNSLQRISLALYGNDPGNWRAAAPMIHLVPDASRDTDGDGIPDGWMITFFGHATGQSGDKSLAGQDADSDGMTNWQEYLAGTNPRDPNSKLRLGIAIGNSVTLTFIAIVNKSYTVEYINSLSSTNWQRLEDIPALMSPPTRLIQLNAPTVGAPRFYRVRSPRLP